MGVPVEDAVDVGEQNQQVGLQQRGDHGGERIIVAENLVLGLNLVEADRVVLIDNWQCAQLQQRVEGALEVGTGYRVVHVCPGEQNLRHGAAVLREELVVEMHQLALSHGGRGLLDRQLGGPLAHAQLHRAHADGARGDEDDLVPGAADIREYPRQMVHIPEVQTAGAVRQGRGTDLDHDSFAHNLIIHSFSTRNR